MTATLLVALAFGSAAFFGVRLVIDRWFVGAQEGGIMPPIDEIRNEELRPRFSGELLGIFIGPDGDAPPKGYATASDLCPDGEGSQQVSWDDAGPLKMDLDLPSEYIIAVDSPNTGAIACSGTVYTARREYRVKTSNGMTADVIIGRSIFRIERFDVATDRVGTAVVGGREAVVIEPITPDGLAQRSGVFFPESFGETFIAASSLPQHDLLELAAIVGEGTTR
jgi:hypothetical protein